MFVGSPDFMIFALYKLIKRFWIRDIPTCKIIDAKCGHFCSYIMWRTS